MDGSGLLDGSRMCFASVEAKTSSLSSEMSRGFSEDENWTGFVCL